MLYQLSYSGDSRQPINIILDNIIAVSAYLIIVGGDGVEPPESKDSRFTVCPATPTVYPPRDSALIYLYPELRLHGGIPYCLCFIKLRM